MSSATLKSRTAWHDRFRTPALDDLMEPFSRQLCGLIESTRQRLVAFPNISEELSWQGIPWRWTLVYRWAGQPERAWAYVVLDPSRVRLTLPMSTELIAKLPAKKLSRPTRDGIVQASEVAGVHWAQWELVNKPQLDELVGIVEAKHLLLTAASSSAPSGT